MGNFTLDRQKKLNALIRVQKQQILDPFVRNTLCCEHFANCGGGNFKIYPFLKIYENEIAHQTKKDYFIRLFNPKLNSE